MGFHYESYRRFLKMTVAVILLLCCQTSFCQPYDQVSFLSNSGSNSKIRTQYNLLARRLEVESVLLTPEQKKIMDTFNYYEQIEDSLDLYDQAFDFLRVVQGGLQLYFSVNKTINTVTTSLEGIASLTNDYIEKCALIGSVREEDQIFYHEALNLYTLLSEDFKHLYNQVEIIIPFIGGKYGFGCTIYTLSELFNDLLETLTLIREHVSGCYHRLYRYMKMRLGFWTPHSLRVFSAKASAQDAFKRWYDAYHSSAVTSITRKD